MGQDSKVAAYYENMLADKLGPEIFSCGDYQQQTADSMLELGPLAGLLELQMRRSMMASAGCAIQ